jgi:hypothetical protein
MKSDRYIVTEVRGVTRSLLLVTRDPREALALARDCRSRSGAFYRIEITNQKGRQVLDCELIDAMQPALITAAGRNGDR